MSSTIYEKYIPLDWNAPERLHSALVNCGHELAADHNYVCDGLRRGPRQLAVWQYTLSGRGRFRIGREWYDVPAGNCFIALIPEDHSYCFDPAFADSWEFIYVTVGGEEAVRLAAAAREKFGTVFAPAPESKTIEAAWNMLRHGKRRRLNDCYNNSSLAYDFMMRLLGEHHNAAAEGKLLCTIRDYCQNNMDKPLSVSELARVSGYSRWHFSRMFSLMAGKPPHDFIIELKMRYAASLFQTTFDSIKEVAVQCGFDDVSYFGKVFKLVNGVSPGKYREVSRNYSSES